MSSEIVVASHGLRLQRHVDALYSDPKHFAPELRQKATISTGITLEYVVHAKDVDGATENEYVMLIMGFRMTKEEWAPIVDQLLERWSSAGRAKNLKIVTFDNRGVGGSDAGWGRYTTSGMAQDAVSLLDHLGWGKAHVVGVSMGGMISLELASNAPSRVHSVSLVVTTRGKYVNEHGDEDIQNVILSSNHDLVVTSTLSTLYPDAALNEKMEDSESTIRQVLSKFHDYRIKQAGSPGWGGTIGQLLAIRTHFVSDSRLAEIGQTGFPILVVGGGDDHMIPGSESELIAEKMASTNVKLVMMHDRGHGLYVHNVDELVEELLATFLRG